MVLAEEDSIAAPRFVVDPQLHVAIECLLGFTHITLTGRGEVTRAGDVEHP